MTDQSGGRTPDEWMNARRLELDMTWTQVRELAGGMNRQTLANIRKTGRGTPLHLRRLERALRWRPDSFAAMERDEPPTAVEDTAHMSREEIEMRRHIQDARRVLGPEKARELLREELSQLENTDGHDPDAGRDFDRLNG